MILWYHFVQYGRPLCSLETHQIKSGAHDPLRGSEHHLNVTLPYAAIPEAVHYWEIISLPLDCSSCCLRCSGCHCPGLLPRSHSCGRPLCHPCPSPPPQRTSLTAWTTSRTNTTVRTIWGTNAVRVQYHYISWQGGMQFTRTVNSWWNVSVDIWHTKGWSNNVGRRDANSSHEGGRKINDSII